MNHRFRADTLALLWVCILLHPTYGGSALTSNYRNCLSHVLDLYSSFLTRVCNSNRTKIEDILPNDCDDTYSIQTNTVCDGNTGKIQLNISDGAFKIVHVNSYGIENCSTCHNFKQVNFTFHLEKLNHSKAKTCLNGSMDTTTISLTSETSNMMGLQIRYVAVIAVSGLVVGVLASFAVWLLRRKISTFISQLKRTTTPESNASCVTSAVYSHPHTQEQNTSNKTYSDVREEIVHGQINRPRSEDSIYNHLHEKQEEDNGSTYDHAQYVSGLKPNLQSEKEYTTFSAFKTQ
uniref:Uncharacterized protein LOC111110566 n=1 Tax=Crassostrea virginica TaxID=6565 RepID=A0A8B8BHU1_CRAVI|nr:uncharacterized protein LOC111110566 [Crassostrea virginica]